MYNIINNKPQYIVKLEKINTKYSVFYIDITIIC